MMLAESTRRVRLNWSLVVFILLTLGLAYTFPRWADPNQNSRMDMVVAIVENGTFQIDEYVSNTVDYAKVDGHYYSDKAPGIALLGVPIYALVREVLELPLLGSLTDRLENSAAFQSTLRTEGTGVSEDKVRFAIAQVALTLFLAVLPTAAIGVLILRYSSTLGRNSKLGVVLALGYGLLTPAFAYGGALYGHQLSAFFLLLAFVGIGEGWFDRGLVRGWMLGAILACSVITEYPALLGVMVVGGWQALRLLRRRAWRQILAVAAGAVPFALALMLYNNYLFGSPFELGYQYSELWVNQHGVGFMSLSAPRLAALWGITFSPFRGLFFLSPWLLLALPGFILWWRSGERQAQLWVSALLVSLFFVFNSSSVMWWGGFAVGPRYLLPALPFLILPIPFIGAEFRRSPFLIAIAALALLWSFFAVWGLTLANQAFPSDSISNPLSEYALTSWREGNIARNLGTILGLKGTFSLLPLLIALAGIGWLASRGELQETGELIGIGAD